MNTLYDLPGEVLRGRKELLRLRKYGSQWTLTHKAKKKTGRHSSRVELETGVEDGKQMDTILRALGYSPRFPSAVEGLLDLAAQSRSRGLLPSPANLLAP